MGKKPENLQAVIFDVDGVLFDTEMLHIRAWQKTLSRFGLEADDKAMEKWVGRPCAEMAEYYAGIIRGPAEPGAGERIEPEKRSPLLKEGNFGNDNLGSRLHQLKEEELHSLLQTQLRAVPGIGGHLAVLSRTLPLAYATTTTREMVGLFFSISGMGKYFSCGITFEDVAQTKPSPEPYLKTLSLLGVSPGGALVLEDSPSGIRAAKSAGLYCLGIAGSLPPEAIPEADIVFPGTAAACMWIEETYGIALPE